MRVLALSLLCACVSVTDAPSDLPVGSGVALVEAGPEADSMVDTDKPTQSRPSPPRPFAAVRRDHPDPKFHQQVQKVKTARYDLQALEFYLVDKRAHEDGEISTSWKQPPLDKYKAQPWCHAPGPHGEHKPPPPPSLPSPDPSELVQSPRQQ